MDIHTNLYTNKASEILDSVLGQLSDGWGENNSGNDGYWMFARINRANNGEVLITISDDFYKSSFSSYRSSTYNKFKGMSEDAIRRKFAYWIKKTTKMDIDDNKLEPWNRHSVTSKLCYLGRHDDVTIAEAYVVYEILLGRNVGITKYDVASIAAVQGSPRSEEEIKLFKTKMANLNKVKFEHDSELKKINDDFELKVENLKKERDIALNICNSAYQASLAEIEKRFSIA